jgi:ubiquinol-cytochrome c reductase cytochrome c subunit
VSGAGRVELGPRWLVVLRSPVLGPLLAIALALLATPLLHQRGAAAAPIDAQAAQDAKQIYLRDCATCHGPDARGTSKGPTLEGQGEAGIDFMISTGRMPLSSPDATMRRHDPAYPPDTIRALVAYIAGLVPGGPGIPTIGSGDLAAGGAIYREQCAACHQAAGEGGALIGQEESPSLHQSTAVQIAEAVRTGPGTMPVFGPAAVSDQEVSSLVRYVRELRDPPDPGGQHLWHLGPMPEGAVAMGALALLIVALRRIGART